MNLSSNKIKRPTAGYTLVELLMAATISLMALGAATTLFVLSLKYYYNGGDKLMANRDLRSFTDEISRTGSNANYFKIYKSISDLTEITSGGTGDMVTYYFIDPADQNETKLVKVVSYFQDPTPVNGRTPIRTFKWENSTSAAFNAATMLPSSTTPHAYKELVQNVQDTTSTTSIFFNFYGKSIIIKANIFYQGTLRPSVSNTYNFTIAPRG